MFIISHAIKHIKRWYKMKVSDVVMVVTIALMLVFIGAKNTEHKKTTFVNVAASVQNTIDK